MPKKLPKNTAYAQALITRGNFNEFRDFFLKHPQYTQTHKDEVGEVSFDYFIGFTNSVHDLTIKQIENPDKIIQDGPVLRRCFKPNIHFCYHCVPDEEVLAKFPFAFKDNRNQLAWDLDFRLSETYVKTKHPILDRFEKRVTGENERRSYILGMHAGFKLAVPYQKGDISVHDGGVTIYGLSEDEAITMVQEVFGDQYSPWIFFDGKLLFGVPPPRFEVNLEKFLLKANDSQEIKRAGFQVALQLFGKVKTQCQLSEPLCFRSCYESASDSYYTPFPPPDMVAGVSLQEDWRILIRDMDPFIEWSYAKLHGECFGTRDGRNQPEVFAIAEAMLYGYPLPVIGMDYIQIGEFLLGPKKNKRAKIICYRHPEGFILTVQGAPGGGLEWLNANTPWVWAEASPVVVKDFSESNEDSANGGWDFLKKVPTRAELQARLVASRPSISKIYEKPVTDPNAPPAS